MNKRKWAQEKSIIKLAMKLGEESGEVFKAILENDHHPEVELILSELDHVVFIAERLKAVLEI